MYEKFTDRARKVMALANKEAQRLNQDHIGTGHILLGIINDRGSVASILLESLNVDTNKINYEIERLVNKDRETKSVGKLPLTPKTIKALEFAIEEARKSNNDYVGTEHLFLGLLKEGQGIAAQVLINLGINLNVVQEEIVKLSNKSKVNKSNYSQDFSWVSNAIANLQNQNASPVQEALLKVEDAIFQLLSSVTISPNNEIDPIKVANNATDIANFIKYFVQLRDKLLSQIDTQKLFVNK